jgi:putative SOS response-associated peptidase YedK
LFTLLRYTAGISHRSMQLLQELEKSWLNPDFTEPEQIIPMLKTSTPDQMESWHVADAAKNPKNDYPELLTPLTY